MSDCMHTKCDVCGIRVCQRRGIGIQCYASVNACSTCVSKAVSFAYQAARAFGPYSTAKCGFTDEVQP